VSSTLTVQIPPGNRGRVREVAFVFARLGATAFGGPAAHIALMESACVTERGWLTRAAFLDQVAIVQLLPGPNSTELAIHLGYLRAGWRGAIVGGLAFLLPSVLSVWVLAAFAAGALVQPYIRGVLWWLIPTVVVVLLHATWTFGGQAARRSNAAVLFGVSAVAAAVVRDDLLVLVIGAGVAALLAKRQRLGSVGVALFVAGLAMSNAALAMASAALGAGSKPSLTSVFGYFLRAGSTVFGSGYVLVGYLQHDLVDERGWITLATLTQASAIAQLTPGPLFATATAVGHAIGGAAYAAVATLGIFLPAFGTVLFSGPMQRLITRQPLVRAILDGIVVASVAVLARAVVGFAWPLRGLQWAVVCFGCALLFTRRISSTLLLVGAVVIGCLSVLLFSTSQ
jgi:chromate transporter